MLSFVIGITHSVRVDFTKIYLTGVFPMTQLWAILQITPPLWTLPSLTPPPPAESGTLGRRVAHARPLPNPAADLWASTGGCYCSTARSTPLPPDAPPAMPPVGNTRGQPERLHPPPSRSGAGFHPDVYQ